MLKTKTRKQHISHIALSTPHQFLIYYQIIKEYNNFVGSIELLARSKIEEPGIHLRLLIRDHYTLPPGVQVLLVVSTRIPLHPDQVAGRDWA